jgi:hypothetical protein
MNNLHSNSISNLRSLMHCLEPSAADNSYVPPLEYRKAS